MLRSNIKKIKMGDHGTIVGGDCYLTFSNSKSVAMPDIVITKGTNVAVTPTFVGRQSELSELREQISQGSKLLLVSGMGGIGKTHICRYLFHEYHTALLNKTVTDIDCIGYLSYNGSMNDTLYSGLSFEKTNDYDADLQKAWEQLVNISKNRRLLLFVDNITREFWQDESLKKLYEINGAVIVTSRFVELQDFKRVEIDVMEYKFCQNLFEHIYKKVDSSELEDLKYVINVLAARHTLTVELLAHLVKNKKDWSIQRLREELEAKQFNLTTKIYGQQTTLQTEYEILFDMAGLSTSEINALEAFSLFPYTEMRADTCNRWLLDDAKAIEDDELFNGLFQKGWLQSTNEAYSMHPVISDVIYSKQKPKFSRHKSLIEKCTNDISIKDTEVFTKAVPYLSFAESVVIKLNCGNVEIANLENQIGLIYLNQNYEKALEWYIKALAISEKVLGKKNVNTATIRNNIAVVYKYQGEYEKALEWHIKALVIFEEVLGKKHPDTATIYNNIAGVYDIQGDYRMSLQWYLKALVIREKVLGKDHPATATTYNDIAGVYNSQGDYKKALESSRKALAIREKVLSKEHPDMATTYNTIAEAYDRLGDYEKALAWHFKALAIREKVLGKEHPDTAATYNNIAGVYSHQGDYEKGLEWYLNALAISQKVLGKEHPETAIIYSNIAGVYDRQGDYEKALVWYFKALAIREKVLGKKHPETAIIYNNVAEVYGRQGDDEKALAWHFKALVIREKVLGKEHSDTAATYNNIGAVYYRQGDYEKALEWYFKALAIQEKALGKKHQNAATVYNNIAVVYDIQGDHGKALEWYFKALEIHENLLGKEHPDTATTYNDIAGVYARQGDGSGA